MPTKHVDVYMKIPDYEEGNDFNQPTKVQTVGMNMKSVIYCTVIKICIKNPMSVFLSHIFVEIKMFACMHHYQSTVLAF